MAGTIISLDILEGQVRTIKEWRGRFASMKNSMASAGVSVSEKEGQKKLSMVESLIG